MKQRRTDRTLLGISVGGYLLMSVSFLLLPFQVVPGIFFWGGLAVGTVLQILLEVRRRAFFAAYKVNRKKMQKPRVGLLCFGSNRSASIADGVMVVSLVAMTVTLIITKGFGYICNVFIAVTVASFCLHCVLNGRIYFHAKNQLKVRQVLENKKVNSISKGEGKNENK